MTQVAGALHEINRSVDSLSKNLENLLFAHQISSTNLAKCLNVPYNTIHRILMGTTADPRVSTIRAIADYFNVTLDYLLSDEHRPKQVGIPVPLYEWAQMRDPSFKNTGHIQKFINVSSLNSKDDHRNFFAIESTKSMQPRFPFGTKFIIDCEVEFMDGDLILIRFKKDNCVTLRELVIDSPHWQLNPVIPGSPTIFFKHEEHSIIGVVVLTLIQTRSYD